MAPSGSLNTSAPHTRGVAPVSPFSFFQVTFLGSLFEPLVKTSTAFKPFPPSLHIG